MNKREIRRLQKEINEKNEGGIPEQPGIIEIVTNSSVFKYFLNGMIVFGVCFVLCFFVFNVLLTQIGVEGYSMQPTINLEAYGNDGEFNTDSMFYLKTSNINNKDIVIIKGGKTDSGEKIIKRVVATPGQTITFKNVREVINANSYIVAEVYVNNIKLEEDYIKKDKDSEYEGNFSSESFLW